MASQFLIHLEKTCEASLTSKTLSSRCTGQTGREQAFVAVEAQVNSYGVKRHTLETRKG